MENKPKQHLFNRREFLAGTGSMLVAPALVEGMTRSGPGTSARAASIAQTEPVHQERPAWWHENGLVMAGIDWEPLLPRLRAGSWDLSEVHMDYDEKMALWRSEHSEDLARRVQQMGFNFVMIPMYKGGGLDAEHESMEDAKRFTKVCHGIGLRVGCYTFGGTILYEPMLAEDPDARDWFTMDHNGNYVPYGSLYFRRFANRNHPGFRNLAQEIVHFAAKEAEVDLIHFDNYTMGPGYEPYSVQDFRRYLSNKYTPEQRRHRFGFRAMDYIVPPPAPPRPDRYNGDPLYRDFVDYRCEVMENTYRDLAKYARSLNPEVVVELNPDGYRGVLSSSLGIGAVDHTRTIQWGGAYWDESPSSRMEDDVMVSHFRSAMMGQYFGNMVFDYTADRVPIAESMANNLQCLGCPAWVTGNKIAPYRSRYSSTEFDPAVLKSIHFFHQYQEYYRDAKPVADIGVLNTYANTAYGPTISRNCWAGFTQALYQGKTPFALVPDSAPGNLSRFRVLVLADLALISDSLLENVRSYVNQGGGLVVTGQSALFDDQNFRRKRAGLADLFSASLASQVLRAKPGHGRAVYVPKITLPANFHLGMLPENQAELLEATRWAAGSPLSVEVTAPATVTMSLYIQPSGRHVLHLVNYDD